MIQAWEDLNCPWGCLSLPISLRGSTQVTIPKLDSSGCDFLMGGLRWQEVSHLHRPLLTPAPVAQSAEASAEPAPLPGAQISVRFSSQIQQPENFNWQSFSSSRPGHCLGSVHSSTAACVGGCVLHYSNGNGAEGVVLAARLLTRARSRPALRFLWQRRNLHISSWTYRCKSKGKPVTFLKSESKLICGTRM